MKKIILSLTVFMSIVGTSFGQTMNRNQKNSTRMEVVQNQKQKSDKGFDDRKCTEMGKKQKEQKPCQCKECQKKRQMTKKQIGKQQVQVRKSQTNQHPQQQDMHKGHK